MKRSTVIPRTACLFSGSKIGKPNKQLGAQELRRKEEREKREEGRSGRSDRSGVTGRRRGRT